MQPQGHQGVLRCGVHPPVRSLGLGHRVDQPGCDEAGRGQRVGVEAGQVLVGGRLHDVESDGPVQPAGLTGRSLAPVPVVGQLVGEEVRRAHPALPVAHPVLQAAPTVPELAPRQRGPDRLGPPVGVRQAAPVAEERQFHRKRQGQLPVGAEQATQDRGTAAPGPADEDRAVRAGRELRGCRRHRGIVEPRQAPGPRRRGCRTWSPLLVHSENRSGAGAGPVPAAQAATTATTTAISSGVGAPRTTRSVGVGVRSQRDVPVLLRAAALARLRAQRPQRRAPPGPGLARAGSPRRCSRARRRCRGWPACRSYSAISSGALGLRVVGLGQLLAVEDVHRALGAHDGDLRRRPGEVDVGRRGAWSP